MKRSLFSTSGTVITRLTMQQILSFFGILINVIFYLVIILDNSFCTEVLETIWD